MRTQALWEECPRAEAAARFQLVEARATPLVADPVGTSFIKPLRKTPLLAYTPHGVHATAGSHQKDPRKVRDISATDAQTVPASE